MPERDAPRPAVSGRDIDIGFVNELHGVATHCGLKSKNPALSAQGFWGSTLQITLQ
jgi:hypothetical protein